MKRRTKWRWLLGVLLIGAASTAWIAHREIYLLWHLGCVPEIELIRLAAPPKGYGSLKGIHTYRCTLTVDTAVDAQFGLVDQWQILQDGDPAPPPPGTLTLAPAPTLSPISWTPVYTTLPAGTHHAEQDSILGQNDLRVRVPLRSRRTGEAIMIEKTVSAADIPDEGPSP